MSAENIALDSRTNFLEPFVKLTRSFFMGLGLDLSKVMK